MKEPKQYALITGATSGIGYSLAKVFAKNGHSLILVGRNKEKLQAVKEELEVKFKLIGEGDIVLIEEDLSCEVAALHVYQKVKTLNLKVTYLINNAGIGYVGETLDAPKERILEMLHLNMNTLTLLTYDIAQDMKASGKGQILNIASTGAYHPGPYTAIYYATKAYVLSFSEALYDELKPYNIIVSSLCPGATKTQFAATAGRDNAGIAMSPDWVAKKAYDGFMKKQRVIVPGLRNKLFIKLPRNLLRKLVKRYQLKLKH